MVRAKQFYESVFQTKLEHLQTPADMPVELWSFPMIENAAGASGALVKMADGPSGGNCACWCIFRALTVLSKLNGQCHRAERLCKLKCRSVNMALSR